MVACAATPLCCRDSLSTREQHNGVAVFCVSTYPGQGIRGREAQLDRCLKNSGGFGGQSPPEANLGIYVKSQAVFWDWLLFVRKNLYITVERLTNQKI
jgi:hypothetical protein